MCVYIHVLFLHLFKHHMSTCVQQNTSTQDPISRGTAARAQSQKHQQQIDCRPLPADEFEGNDPVFAQLWCTFFKMCLSASPGEHIFCIAGYGSELFH